VRLPKVHDGGTDATTPVDIYVSESEDACSLRLDDFGQGMGLAAQLWTTRAGLEALRDKLNAVLVRTEGAS
jgi:hypothetical protein